MKFSTIALASLAALAMLGASSCQRDQANLTTSRAGGQHASNSPSEGCATLTPLLPRAACDDSNLRAQDADLAIGVREQLKILSWDGQQILLNDETKWFEAERAECAIAMTDKTMPQESKLCLSLGLLGRLISVSALTDWNGPYLVQRVDNVFTTKLHSPGGDAWSNTHAADVFMSAIAYPRIDGAAPGVAAFNAAAARTPRFTADDQTEEITIYKIAYAGPDIVSAEFVSYALPMGGLGKTRQVHALSFLMKEGRPIQDDDVFSPKTAWADFVAAKASLKIAGAHDACDTPRSRADLRVAVSHAENWVIAEDGLVVLLPTYSVEQDSLEGCSVMISWSDLAPFVKARPPAPIGVRNTVRLLANG